MGKHFTEPTLRFPPTPERMRPVPWAYRFWRKLVRIWSLFFFRKIRLLHAEALPVQGAVVLAVCRPPAFLDSLVLVAVFDRKIHCLLSASLLDEALKRWMARRLGMIVFEPSARGRQRAADTCCDLLARGETIVVFAEDGTGKREREEGHASVAAMLAFQAESRHSFQLGLKIFPLHVFQPVAGARKAGMLIYVDSPVCVSDHIARGEAAGEEASLTTALQAVCRENAFRLQPEQVEEFLTGLEEALRIELEEDWASRPNWKQTVEGFELSAFVRACVQQMNYLSPGRLVGLSEYLQTYQQAQRRLARRRAEIELASDWIQARWRRLAVWVEALLGLPLACYGLINHVLVWLVLFWAGLLKKESERSRRVEWVLRGLVGLAGYAAQTLLAARWMGKTGALIYGLSLPLSGAYLWRYGWLLGRRVRVLLVAAGLPARVSRARRLRKNLIEELNASCRAYARRLGIAH